MTYSDIKSSYIQYQLIDYIINNSKKPIKNFSDLSHEDKCYRMFSNFRLENSIPKGIRLTSFGNTLLSKHFTKYEFSLQEPLVGSMLINLDKNMSWPYFLNSKRVIFYSQEDAGWFKLGGENLKYFGESIV